MNVDHQRLIFDLKYLEHISQLCTQMAQKPGLTRLSIMHENDGSCCETQPWATTSSRLFAPIYASMTRHAPEEIAALLAQHEPAVVIVAGRPVRTARS